MNTYLPIPMPDRIPEPINQFLKDLLGPSFQELGLFFGDQVRLLRFSRCIKILEKSKEILKNANISPGNINLKFLVPFLEKSTLEEDEDLTMKWAGLLASSATNHKLQYSYINILSELNPIEIKLLDMIFDSNNKSGTTYIDWKTQGIDKDDICRILSLFESDHEIMMNNLFRLNLCQPIGSLGVKFGDEPVALKTSKIVNLTLFGYDFVKTCRGPRLV